MRRALAIARGVLIALGVLGLQLAMLCYSGLPR